jgi:hypothetical protein
MSETDGWYNHTDHFWKDVTPAPVSRLQFEKEKFEHASRGESPPTCRICEVLLSWLFDPSRRRKSTRLSRGLDGHIPVSSPERHDSDSSNRKFQPQVMHLGTFKEALASPCSQHTALVKHLQLRLEDDLQRGHMASIDPRLDLIRHYSGVVRVERAVSSRIRGRLVLALANNPGAGNFQNIRVLDREWFDLHVIKGWIDDCSKLHGEHCKNPMKISRTIPDLLVDVKRKCIVKGREGLKYMALSYRLGNATPFRLRLHDLDTFRNNAILEDVQILESLPLTVRHAILLADELGFDYLWTDVLCIVHDGPTALADQLDKMSAIFANAAITTVVADRDGADGIVGLHGVSGPRDSTQLVFPIRDEHLIIPEEEVIDDIHGGMAYHTRGWTYQEYIMSRRRLVLTDQQAYWVCQHGKKNESDAHHTRAEYRVSKSIAESEFVRSGYPDLARLADLLSRYNIRDLTYHRDALPAISGLLAVLSRGFEGGFLYGLPERFFDIALSWQPHEIYGFRSDDACGMRRGSPRFWNPGSTTTDASEMPSWSWAAWQGTFSFLHDEVDRISTTQSSPQRQLFRESSPVTAWYTSSDLSSSHRRRISSNWHFDRKDVDSKDRPLPEGWNRMDGSAAFKTLGQTKKRFWRPIIYRHQSMASEPPTFWSYPFRMPKVDESTPFKIPKQTRYLFCKTWTASVWIHRHWLQTKCDDWDGKLCLHLRDGPRSGPRCPSKIGTVWLHSQEQFEGTLKPATGEDGTNAVIHVVAISRSSFSGQDHPPDQKPWRPDEINILWVKWEEGIAYRLASGYVREEDWWRLDLEEIDLVLG